MQQIKTKKINNEMKIFNENLTISSKSNIVTRGASKRTALGEITNVNDISKLKIQKKTNISISNKNVLNENRRIPIQKKNNNSKKLKNSTNIEDILIEEENKENVENVESMDIEAHLEKIELSDDEMNDPIEDIDQYDHDDPQFCTEYVNEIFKYFKKKEVIFL